MQRINIPEGLYDKALETARAQGVESVDAFVCELLRQYLTQEPEDLDALFTPSVLEELDQRYQSAVAGNTRPLEQISADFASTRNVRTRFATGKTEDSADSAENG